MIPTTLIFACLLGVVRANTPLSASFVDNDIAGSGGFDIAMAARPMWHFGRALNQNPCYPTWATTNDGKQTTPASVYPWPKSGGGGCADPGPRGEGKPFPTYWTTNKCKDDEIRVVYNLYYQKDGFNPGGHQHDWERVIVIWNRKGDQWFRTKLLKSFHAGYNADEWNKIQNTVNLDNIQEQGAKDKDHPKVYCGWGKHAMFTDRKTGFNDILSQSTNQEFRSNDWYRVNTNSEMIGGGKGSPVGDLIKSMNWGSADSGPTVVQERVCSEHA